MVTDVRASKMFLLLHEGSSVAEISRRLEMSEKTVRKYRDSDQLPSQTERPGRTYRTRPDPLADYWDEIEALLRSDWRIKSYTILGWLKQKYNPVDGEPVITSSIRRTLERRVGRWKLEQGIEQEVKFPQTHHPGDVLAFDFVVLNGLKVTIDNRPFDHMMFHSVFTYSNWEHVHLCHSESFEALSTGLQDTLYRAGGAPQRIRSDSLSAAVNNLSSDKEFAASYGGLLSYFGVKGHRINVRKPHENGDVESSHGHFKDALDQALRIRGGRDFAGREDYMEFVRAIVHRRNADRQKRFSEEAVALSPLPSQRLQTNTSVMVTVKSDSIIRVKRNAYSVNSKFIGLRLEVRIHQDHLELWYRNECVEEMPRQFGNGKEIIDFRHVIDSLIRKPGAFANYKYVNHMYPTTRFRMAYDQLLSRTTQRSAVKQYLKLLHAAKHEGLDRVDDVLRSFLTCGKTIDADEILLAVTAQTQIPLPTEIHVEATDLSVFDSLLLHKEVYDDEETSSVHGQPPPAEGRAEENSQGEDGLAAYDRHVQSSGAAEVPASSDVSRELSGDVRPGGARAVDAHAVPGGHGRAGMSSEDPKPDRAVDAKLEFVGGQDLGSIRLVSVATACDAAVRDASARGLSGPPGQRVDLWQTGFGENHVAFGTRRSTRQAGAVGLFLDVPDAGANVAPCKAGPTSGAGNQEASKVRRVDHRRPRIRSAEPRGDGGVVHVVVGTIRTGQRSAQFESAVFEMGTDLQGPDDDGRCDRPIDPSFGDYRTQHPKLSTGDCNKETNQKKNQTRWFKTIISTFLPVPSSCR
jgi:transposase